MITSIGYTIPRKVIKKINRFLRANKEISWIGSKDPREWGYIYDEYKASRKEFLAMIEQFCSEGGYK